MRCDLDSLEDEFDTNQNLHELRKKVKNIETNGNSYFNELEISLSPQFKGEIGIVRAPNKSLSNITKMQIRNLTTKILQNMNYNS